jgi:hypothetical protein
MEEDSTKDLAEFALANAIYAALVEGHACEISARCVYKYFMDIDMPSNQPLISSACSFFVKSLSLGFMLQS